MKRLALLAVVAALTGCGKFHDMVTTGMDGFTIRCIEGVRYVLLSSDRGLAIYPLVDTEGKPRGCGK